MARRCLTETRSPCIAVRLHIDKFRWARSLAELRNDGIMNTGSRDGQTSAFDIKGHIGVHNERHNDIRRLVNTHETTLDQRASTADRRDKAPRHMKITWAAHPHEEDV